MEFLLSLTVLIIVISIAIVFSRIAKPSRTKRLMALAQNKDWYFQNVGGLPKELLFLSFSSIAPETMRQHGHTIHGQEDGFLFYVTDISRINKRMETQSIIIVRRSAVSHREDWRLVFKPNSKIDSTLESISHMLHRRWLLLTNSTWRTAKALQHLKYSADHGIVIEWHQNNLILFKPNHILEPNLIYPAIQQALNLYEQLESL